MTPFEIAKHNKGILEKRVKDASEKLNQFPKGPIGLVPNNIKNTEEYKVAKKQYETAFEALKRFNIIFLKHFKNELRMERR